MSQFDKIVMKLLNYFIEQADGNMVEGRELYKVWVATSIPVISAEGADSWHALVLGLDVAFQEAMRPAASE
jgi:hypothetical protein